MKEIVIVGAGGFGYEVADLAERCGYTVKGFLDDGENLDETYIDYPLLGKVDAWKEFSAASFVIAIGNPRVRKAIVEKMCSTGEPGFATLLHPSVEIADSVSIGAGSIITKGVVITVKVNIAQHVIVNVNSTIGHETVLEDYVNVAPMVAVSGNVTLGYGVEVGTGASIRQGLSLANGSMLGMGSVLTKNIPSAQMFFGCPAKRMKDLKAL